jgi:hypothetical protein
MHYIYYCVTYVTADNMKHTWVFKVPNILVWLNQIWIFLTDSHKSHEYQIPQKSVQQEPLW